MNGDKEKDRKKVFDALRKKPSGITAKELQKKVPDLKLEELYLILNELKDSEGVIRDKGKWIYNPYHDISYVDWNNNFEKLDKLYKLKIPTILIGPKGTGKTQCVIALQEMHGFEMQSVNLSLRAREHHLIGRLDIQKNSTGDNHVVWKEGPLPLSMRAGGVIYLDELNSITGDTKLYYREDDVLKFGKVDRINVDSNIEVLSLSSTNTKEARATWKPAKLIKFKTRKLIYDITLRKGKRISVTKDHSLFCRRYKNIVDKADSKPTSEILDEYISVMNSTNFEDVRNNDNVSDLSDDELVLAGLWIGDGSFGDNRTIRITTGRNICVDNFLKKAFPIELTKTFLVWSQLVNEKIDYNKPNKKCLNLYEHGFSRDTIYLAREHIRKGTIPKNKLMAHETGRFDITISDKDLKEKIENSGFSYEYNIIHKLGKGKLKCIPNWLMVSSDREVSLFLKGWFSADGCHTNRRGNRTPTVYLNNKHRELLEKVRVLLLRFGIDCAIRRTMQKPVFGGDGINHALVISDSKSYANFFKHIGFIQKDKNKPQNWISKCTKYDFTFDKVKSVKKRYVNEVYDFSVKDNESFIVSNGIVAHNSAEPDVLLRLDECLDDRKELNYEGQTIKAKEGWWAVSSINPLDHPGTKELPPQLLSRFSARLYFDYPDPHTEIKIIKHKVGTKKGEDETLLKILNLFNKLRKSGEMPYTPSIRESITVSKLMQSGMPMKDILDIVLINPMAQWGKAPVDKVRELAISIGVYMDEELKNKSKNE